jgi:DNA-binding SARP family transcriptional activator
MDAIHLLGVPHVERDYEVVAAPKGKKVWGLIAYLLAAARPPTRSHVAELLFADADDPLRALRWTLNEARGFLPGEVGGDPLQITLRPGCMVDSRVAISGRWEEAIRLPNIGRELLEGVDLSVSPAFDAWLLNERRHVRAASEAVLQEAVLAFLGRGMSEDAVDWAVRLVALDPLNESHQGSLIRAYATAGDRSAAARQLEACRALFQRELGVEPSESLAAALVPGPVSAVSAPVGGPAAARAQLEAGEAAIRSGAFDAGLECLKRATVEAHSCGDLHLKQRALFATGSALVHAGRAVQDEGAAALHEVIELSDRLGTPDLEAKAAYELGWLEFLAARYGRADSWLARALEKAGSDATLRSSALIILGKVSMERGEYALSLRHIHSAIASAESAGADGNLGFALSSLGRTFLLMRRLGEARVALERSLDVLTTAGILSLIAIPESFFSEVQLLEGRTDEARASADHAFALASEIGDATQLCLAQRSRALVDVEAGRVDEGIAHLVEARQRLVLHPDHTWSMAYALDALCAVATRNARPEARGWVDDLEAVAGRSGMSEMIARAYMYRAARGESGALSTAVALAQGIDNPYLHRQLAELGSASGPPASVGVWSSGASSVSPRTSSL